MAKVDGGELIGRALAKEGIEKAFVLCGGHIMPIFYGMRNNGIEIIDMRHECAAAYAAIAYTRASGKPAAVVTTAGPGVGNTVAGMMEAQTMGIPMIHLGGAVTMQARDAGDLQDMDTLRVLKTCTKWAKRPTYVHRLPEYVAMACRHMWDKTPGPVYLEIPTNLCNQTAEEDEVVFPPGYRAHSIPAGDPAVIEQAAELLVNAERPAAVMDDGARFNIGDHVDAIKELSDYLGMPLGASANGIRGMFGSETENPLVRVNATGNADVVLTLGCQFDFRMGKGAGIKPDAKVIQVHADSSLIGYNLRADIGIIGGVGPVASQLLAAVKAKKDKPAEGSWVGEIKSNWPADLPGAYQSEGTPMHPARCAGEAVKFIAEEGKDWNIITDGGEASVWMGGAVRAIRPGQVHASGANGTIGTGPCLAVGAWVANRKPVFWYTGDGSFGFYAMEMDTMARKGIPCVCVISNDSAWGMIRLEQILYRADKIKDLGQANTELYDMRDYHKMVSMWDGYGEKVTDPDEVLPAIKRAAKAALEGNKPCLINVQVDHTSPSQFIAGYSAMTKTDK